MGRLRANGEGTVTKRKTPAGICWQIAIYDDDGKRHYRYFKTEPDAKAALKEAQKARDQGRPVKPERHSLRQLFDAWLESLAAQVERGERSFNTLREYRSYVETHMKPALGAIDCQRLSVRDVEDYLSHLRLSAKTRANHRIALRRALNVALKWGWVDRNVVTLTDPIPQQPREVPALSLTDGQKLLAALQDDPLWSVYVTALFTGLRAGELAGLAVEHLDLTARTARICQQVQRVPGHGLVVKGLKTRASNATIDLLPDVVAVLCGAIGERTDGFVWLTKSGQPYDPAYLTHHFQAALTKAGLPAIPLHHLRHYFVSFLPLLDVHPTVARQLARHASVSTTMNIYTSVEEGLKRQAMSRLHEALRAAPITADVPTDVQATGSRGISQAHASDGRIPR
jgi:integrase